MHEKAKRKSPTLSANVDGYMCVHVRACVYERNVSAILISPTIRTCTFLYFAAINSPPLAHYDFISLLFCIRLFHRALPFDFLRRFFFFCSVIPRTHDSHMDVKHATHSHILDACSVCPMMPITSQRHYPMHLARCSSLTGSPIPTNNLNCIVSALCLGLEWLIGAVHIHSCVFGCMSGCDVLNWGAMWANSQCQSKFITLAAPSAIEGIWNARVRRHLY